MTDQRNRAVLEIQQNDLTPREALTVVSSFWKSVANFFCWMRNAVLTTFITHKRILYIYMDCDQCFGVDVTMETPSLLQPAAPTCLKTSTSGKCSLEHVRKRTNHIKNDMDALNKIYEELQNLKVFDASENTTAEKTSVVNETNIGEITKDSKLTEMSNFETSFFEDCVSRICRISLSDFTATFNTFVRQNGRDFSKSDLSWWFDKFTKYIYLKEMINGEPTHLREQLIFRSIQSKRDSIMQRLYTLRDKHEFHLSGKIFCDRLKAQSLDQIKKIITCIKGSGDINDVKDVKIANESNPSQKERKVVTFRENGSASCSAKAGESTHHASCKVRPETIDLENEKLHVENKTKDNKQKKISESRTKKQKKGTPKTQEKEKLLEPDVKDMFSTLYPGCKIIPLGPQNMTPSRDESKLLNSKIYITRDGLVKVSKYLHSNSNFKRVGNTGYEQARIINFFVDPLDEKDPLPPNVEVKPMPCGGMEEALLDMQKSTKEEIDEISRVTSQAKEMHRLPQNCEKLDKSDTSPQEQNSANTSQNANFDNQSVHLWPMPPRYLLQNQLNFARIVKEGIEQHCGKPLGSLERLGQPAVESKIKHAAKVTESVLTSRSNLEKQDDALRTGTKQESQSKEQGSKKRKPVSDKRKTKTQLEDTSEEQQSQRTSDNLSKEETPPVPCTEVLDKHQIFDQLSPLNFIDTDNENEASCTIKEPVYYETNATVDYSRHAVEPSHGDRPNKKKLQAKMKEKIKTKGEANKHLKAKQGNTPYLYEEINADDSVNDTVDDEEESELDISTAEQTEEVSAQSLMVCATDQPQVQDDREFMMVPEEIKRLEDPRLKEIEDKYSVASNTAKKDRKKRKEKKAKVKRNIPLVLATDF